MMHECINNFNETLGFLTFLWDMLKDSDAVSQPSIDLWSVSPLCLSDTLKNLTELG